LPVPFAGTVVDPILRGASPDVLSRLSSRRDVFRATRGTYGRLSALRGTPFFGAFGYSVYGDAGYVPNGTTVPIEPVMVREGRLNLSISPASAHVFVDGLYVGAVSDFQDRGLWLEPGPRRIELRADGYETLTFDVRIDENATVNYRRELARAVARQEPPQPAAPPKTFYVIPGCYAGDTKPSESQLPKGCSPKNVREIPPVLSRLTPAAGTQPSPGARPTLPPR
jgi:hypothetical protein